MYTSSSKRGIDDDGLSGMKGGKGGRMVLRGEYPSKITTQLISVDPLNFQD